MTPHIEAQKEDIADVVLMPGDPLRAKLIATKYLKNTKEQVNWVRNMLGYTGEYKGKRITTIGSGMGMPSMGIYAYELYKFYDVKKIIRIGSCGSFTQDLEMLDIVLAEKAYTEGNFAYTFNSCTDKVAYPTEELNNKIYEKSMELDIPVKKATVMTSDCFDWYVESVDDILNRVPEGIKVDVAEMEAFALFYLAKVMGREAACLASVVDNHYTKEEVSSEVREKKLLKMIELALESVI
ncbi:MAG: purine-nucleoside phosphorylase [Oscillospiraceae bacterium]|nr:purine-nucleoside phosphorylase [Oscillospiraceae bacterium]